MKRYYFDDENQNIVDYSTYWYGTINVNNKQLNYSNLVHIKDIFETKYNIELEWLSIDENQIKIMNYDCKTTCHIIASTH